jgi:hypothetical protein
MKLDQARNVVVGAFCAVAMLAVAGNAQAAVRVGGWSLRANGQVAQNFQYAGPCPVSLKFGWGLIGTEPATLAYSFVRSDGGHSSSQLVGSIPRANQSVPVYYDWRLGASTPQFENFRGWVELHVDSPNRVAKRIDFTLHCQ